MAGQDDRLTAAFRRSGEQRGCARQRAHPGMQGARRRQEGEWDLMAQPRRRLRQVRRRRQAEGRRVQRTIGTVLQGVPRCRGALRSVFPGLDPLDPWVVQISTQLLSVADARAWLNAGASDPSRMARAAIQLVSRRWVRSARIYSHSRCRACIELTSIQAGEQYPASKHATVPAIGRNGAGRPEVRQTCEVKAAVTRSRAHQKAAST
jgi:hypothetical protein